MVLVHLVTVAHPSPWGIDDFSVRNVAETPQVQAPVRSTAVAASMAIVFPMECARWKTKKVAQVF